MQNLSETQVIIIVALSLTLITLLLLCIGVIAPYWIYREASGTRYYQGLWQSCTHVDSYEECVDISKTGWLEAALAVELVGLILLCIAVIGFFVHIFVLRGNRVLYVIIAVILFIAGIFILVGAAIYASNVGTSSGNIHFAFALCLASSVLAVIVAFIMLVYLLCTKTSKSDIESGGGGPSTSQWIAPRNRSAHKSRASLLRDTDDANAAASDQRARSRTSGRNEAGPSTAIAEEEDGARSERTRSAVRSERGKKKTCCMCCYCCCCKDSDAEDDDRANVEENQEVEVLQEYDENDEIIEQKEQESYKQDQDENLDNSAQGEQGDNSEQKAQNFDNTDNYENQETQGDSKDTTKNSEETQQGSQTFKSVALLDITEQHQETDKETVVILQQDDVITAPTESNTDDPDESLYAQVHPEPSTEQQGTTTDEEQQQTATNDEQQQATTITDNETGSKTSLREDETLVVIPEDDTEDSKNSKKRGTVFKFRRPPLKRSKSDGTVLKAKVQLYEVSQKDNKMILVSSDYVPDEDIQSIASSQQTSANGIRQAYDSDSDNSQKDKDSSDFEDEIEEEQRNGEYKTIKIRTRKRTKRVKVKGIFGEPVHSPYGYTNANNEHRQIVRYLKTSPYFSSLPPQPVKPSMSPPKDNERPKWKI